MNGLLKPDAYPDRTVHIKLVQTQMSFVFLTDEYAYKVKRRLTWAIWTTPLSITAG